MNICNKISKNNIVSDSYERELNGSEKEPKKGLNFDYDEQGTEQVSEQIMNAYHSGVIDQADGHYETLKDESEQEDEMS